MSLKLKDEDSTKRMKDMQEELKDPSLGEFSDLEQDPYVIESKRTTPIDKPVYQPDGKLSSATDRNPYILSEEKYSLQGTTQGRYLTGGVPPVRFSM